MALLKRLADVEHRDVSNMIAKLVLDEAGRRGWLKEPKKNRRSPGLSAVT